jgi:zinc protease
MPISAHAGAQPATTSNPLAVTWPQDTSDIKPDPDARFGRLANGMSYVIYKNSTPPGHVVVHLRIAAGSLMENENERGLAHFIEHMAFNGSVNIPKDQLLPLLQRHGIALGPDAGAFTLPNKTEYMFELPTNDTESIDTALMIAREFAGNLLFQPDAVERERSVILGEERLRESPQAVAQDEWFKAAFPGQKFGTRGDPIGLPDIIRTATPATLAGYYHAFYRPELTALVIVGDVDPDAIEKKITAKFSDWKAKVPPRSVDFGAYKPKGETSYVRQGKALPDVATVSWFKPFDGRTQTEASAFNEMLDTVLVTVLNQRFQHEAQQPDSLLVGTSLAQQSVGHTAEMLQVTIVPKPGKDKQAFEQAIAILKQFKDRGVSADEVAPIVTRFQAFFKTQAAGAKTRADEAIASDVIDSFDNNSVFTSPGQDIAYFNRLAVGLTAQRANERLKTLFSGDGPLLSHTAEDLAGLDADALKSAFAEAMAGSTRAYATLANKIWPYTDFGPAKQPVSEQSYPSFGFTRYRFANGVRLNVKPTRFSDDQVLVSIRFRGGLETLSPGTNAPVGLAELYANAGGFVAGGLGKLDQEELQTALSGKTTDLDYSLGDNVTTLSGTTVRADLATQLQLMMAYTTDAAYRPAFFTQFHSALPTIYAQMTGAPQGVLGEQLSALIHSGDKRFAFPTLSDAESVNFPDVRDFLKRTLKDKPIEITIVGDVDPAVAVSEVSKTFATLPMLPQNPVIAVGGDKVTFPPGGLDAVLFHKGRPDQSISLMAWPLPDRFQDSKVTRGLELLTKILDQRVFETVREKLGQAYDASADSDQSLVFKKFGVLEVSGSVVAGQDPAFRQAVSGIVEDLKSRLVSQDELDRARKPLMEHWVSEQKDNDYWRHIIPPVAVNKIQSDFARDARDELLAITPAMIQSLAEKYLVADLALHVRVLPEPAKSVAQK